MKTNTAKAAKTTKTPANTSAALRTLTAMLRMKRIFVRLNDSTDSIVAEVLSGADGKRMKRIFSVNASIYADIAETTAGIADLSTAASTEFACAKKPAKAKNR